MNQVATKEKNKIKIKLPERKWYLVDASGKVLGRLATRIATLLMGKSKVDWQPHLDRGDYVIVVNAKDVAVTGTKEENKMYYRYSGYPGGLREEKLKSLRKRKPQDIIYHAVKGMLPGTRLGRAMLKKLYVYEGENHQHEAQKPEKLEV